MEYAARHGRTLVIDTLSTAFGDDLGQYFEPLDASVVFASPALLDHLEKLGTYPRCLQGRLNTYAHRYSRAHRNYVTTDTHELISFDFNRAYEEPLLVHHACGGRLASLGALQHLRLRQAIAESFYSRMAILGRRYAGVHVRHTDYRSDYVRFFHTIAGKIKQDRILICTDNREVLEYGKAFFKLPVYNFSALPDMNGKPLHYRNQPDKRGTNTDSILDLIMLARSRMLFITPVNNGRYSGFSLLAAALNQNQPLVDALLGRTGKSATHGAV